MSCCRDKNILPVKFLDAESQLPTRVNSGDAGLDLYSTEEVCISPGMIASVSTGISVAIPEGCVGLVWPRSGLAAKNGIDVMAGVIDYGYTGPLRVILVNHGDQNVVLPAGSKVAQLIIQKVFYVTPVQVENLEETTRGQSGFGSSGV